MSFLFTSNVFSDTEKRFLDPNVILPAIDVRDIAKMTIKQIDIGSKNASQNFNINDTDKNAIDMRVMDELEIAKPLLLQTQNLIINLTQIKNAVEYNILHQEGMSAEPDLVERVSRGYQISTNETLYRMQATMVAMRKLVESVGRYNSKELVRAFTRDEIILVNGVQTPVTAADMGFLDLGEPTDDSNTPLDEGINIKTVTQMISRFKMRCPDTFTTNVELRDSNGTSKIEKQTFNGIMLMTQQEIADLREESRKTNTGAAAIGYLPYMVFRGFESVISVGNEGEDRGGISAVTIDGCLILVLSNLYTTPEMTILDIDSDHTDIGDPNNVQIERKILLYHPSSLTLWQNRLSMAVDKLTGSATIFNANAEVRTRISKSRINGGVYVTIKRKIPNPLLAYAFKHNKGKMPQSVGTRDASPDFVNRNNNIDTDGIECYDKETGKTIFTHTTPAYGAKNNNIDIKTAKTEAIKNSGKPITASI